jgi:microcystin-dependent protein
VTGALLSLCEECNWEVYGDITPEEAAAYYWDWLQEFLEGYTPGGGTMPIGAVYLCASDPIPAGTLLCDGTQYAKLDYPDLYAALDAVYIVDADNFITPPLANNFPVGAGDTYDQGDEGGEDTHTLSEAEMPAHAHGPGSGASHQNYQYSGGLWNWAAGIKGSTSSLTASAGGGGAHENRPSFHAMRYVIVAESS